MIATTGKITMLYCPKCRRTYENGTRRFCDNDGGRLLPAPTAVNDASHAGGVFSGLLGKSPQKGETGDLPKSAPLFVPFNKTEETDVKLTSFPSAGRIFQSEQFLNPLPERAEEAEESILELDPQPVKPARTVLEFEPVVESEKHETARENGSEETPKPLPRLIRPNEIASGTADVGDRRINPLGRKAFNPENTAALVGQTVKGRYLVTEQLAEDDEESVIYLAEDQIFDNKKTVVRIFLNDYAGAADVEDKVFAEERVSLSHLKHPNIAGVFDSGELPEGNRFIVSEYVEGKTLAKTMREAVKFNSLRTARIIRQASYALSEAHQNGILHRNLKPANIVLAVSEAGIEQVKLLNFGVSRGEINESNFAYKAPEELEKGASTYASDIYALAVIAFEMLTDRYPFDFETDKELLKAQKRGKRLSITELRGDVQPLTDKILEKALASNAAERYPKARDFGDSFFNALTTVAPWTPEEAEETETARKFAVEPPRDQSEPEIKVDESPITADIHIMPSKTAEDVSETKTSAERAWEKRSPEPPQTGTSWRGWAAIAAVVALLIIFWGASRWYFNRASQTENQSKTVTTETPAVAPIQNALPPIDADMPPAPRVQTAPQNFVRFQSNRDELSGELAKNFLSFEVYYPQDWTKNQTDTNFLDISNGSSDNGTLVEQMIVTRYKSKGTMTLDRQEFPNLAENSNQLLKARLGENFKVTSEGETVIQNGRLKAYEVKFQSSGVNKKGEKIMVWGRRFWIPVQNAGEQNGFVLTLLATSLSDEVKSVDDVGAKGDLAKVLETFEPEQIGNR